MGQAKNRKAEIEALKADNIPTVGITYIYESKDMQDDEAYATISIRTNRNGLKDAVKAAQEVGLTKERLYVAVRQAFKEMLAYEGGVDQWLATDTGRKYGAAMVAYLMTFESVKAAGDLTYNMGHVITVKEWCEDNPNGAKNGINRFAFALDYTGWEDLVRATEADSELRRQLYEPLFSNDPMVRMMGMMTMPHHFTA